MVDASDDSKRWQLLAIFDAQLLCYHGSTGYSKPFTSTTLMVGLEPVMHPLQEEKLHKVAWDSSEEVLSRFLFGVRNDF